MIGTAKIGMVREEAFTVEPAHSIDFAEGGMPAVLSTPALVNLLERTARNLVAPLLEPGERTVGTEIELRHMAPTPVGGRVTCLARVVQAEGGSMGFHVEAHDAHECIARGFHRRQVVRVDRFSAKVKRKA